MSQKDLNFRAGYAKGLEEAAQMLKQEADLRRMMARTESREHQIMTFESADALDIMSELIMGKAEQC